MLNQIFFETLLSCFISIIFIISWLIYYLNINHTTTPAPLNSDIKKPKLIDLNASIGLTATALLVLWLFLINFVFIIQFNSILIFCDSVHLSHNSAVYFFVLLSILFAILISGRSLIKQNISFSPEYLIFIIILIISGYTLISSNTLFLTIFLLELISLLIFGKMAISRVVIKKNKLETKNPTKHNKYSWGLFNTLFFQFWANFISSICLFFSLINIHHMFGTSSFFVSNFLLSFISLNWYLNNAFVGFILILLTTGFFIKLGLAPYQFFKIELYKGIPLYIIIVYTTIYLIIYIYIFIYLYLYQLSVLRNFTGLYISFILFISLTYLISLLFDTKNFKAFLSYSTLITISNLFVGILVL